MKLIVGLGNPGDEYKNTRHNLGFMTLDEYAKKHLGPQISWNEDKKFKAEIIKLSPELWLVKPQTYMNHSGMAVTLLANFYKIKPWDIWAVHDDIDLPVGKIRIRRGGASAGHHGIESIIKILGTSDFLRFRMGIGRGKLNKTKTADQNLHRREIEKYVLSLFNQREGSELKHLIKKATEALELSLDKGIEKAMNRFN